MTPPIIGWGDYLLDDPAIGALILTAVLVALYTIRQVRSLRPRRRLRLVVNNPRPRARLAIVLTFPTERNHAS